jgi:hypothetical protein
MLVAPLAYAGQYKVSTSTADDPRIQEAFGSILQLGRPAKEGEIEKAMFDWLENQTHNYERGKNMATFSPPPLASATPGTTKK